MTCEECLALAGDHIDGILGPIDAARFEAHIAGCAPCARYQRVLVRGLSLARSVEIIEPSPDFETRLEVRLRVADQEMDDHQASVRSGVAVALGLAAVVAFVSWTPLLVWSRGTPGQATGVPAIVAEVDADSTLEDDVTNEWFVGAVPTRAFQQPDVSNTFPGPYSPLLIDPPLGRGRTVLTSLTRAE